jgi:uncharacterized membrane protein HdeD (DUF308 family)
MLFVSLVGLGVILLVGGITAVIYRRRHRDRMHASTFVNVVLIFVGVALAAYSTIVTYQVSPTLRLVGFSFPAAAWEFGGSYWADFAGPMTLPLTFLNAMVWLLAPQTIFVVGLLVRQPSQGRSAA